MSDHPDLKRARRAKVIDSAVDRLPPHDLESEQAALGCMMLDAAETVPMFQARGFGTDIFYDLRHADICECLLTMHDERVPLDLVTVRHRLKTEGKLDQVGGVSYLTALVDATPSSANFPFYLDIIEEQALLRRAIRTCSQFVAEAYDATDSEHADVFERLDALESKLSRLNSAANTTEYHQPKVLVQTAINNIEESLRNGGAITGITTGLIDLDRATRGFKGGEMIVIAARPSAGKTSLAMNIAENVAIVLDLPVGVFSLEMSAASLMRRMLCTNAKVNTGRGELNNREMECLMSSAIRLGKSKLFIDDTAGISILQLRAKARRMAQKQGVKLIVIDYLQLVHSSKKCDSREQEIGDVSVGIKELAKELNIPIVVLAQLNRESEKENRKPKMSDLRGSGSIEQDADFIGLLHKPKVEEGDESAVNHSAQPVDMFVAKQRDGPAGMDLNFIFLKEITRFESCAKVSDEDVPSGQRIGKNHAAADI